MKRSPIKRKPVKRPAGFDNPAYRAWLKEWPCYVCLSGWCLFVEYTVASIPPSMREAIASSWRCGDAFLVGIVACSQAVTEVAHVGDRGLGQRCPDREAIPLGVPHHRTGKDAHHVLGKNFWSHHGLDRDEVIATLQKLYEQETGKVA